MCLPAQTAELQSLVSLEAMSAPPRGSRECAGLPHLVEDGVNGYLFEPNNAQDLAKSWRLLSLPAAEREQMGRESHRIVGFTELRTPGAPSRSCTEDAPYQRLT